MVKLKSQKWLVTSQSELHRMRRSLTSSKPVKVEKKKLYVSVNKALVDHLRKKANPSPTPTAVNRSKPVIAKTSKKERCQRRTGQTKLSGNVVATEIDPIRYGAMYQKVKDLDEKVDKIESQVEALVGFASKLKGGLLLASILVPVATAMTTLIVTKLWG